MFKRLRKWYYANSTPRRTRPEFPYRFRFPDDPLPVVIRAHNQRQARQFVRDSLDLTRLPIGTTVERLDT